MMAPKKTLQDLIDLARNAGWDVEPGGFLAIHADRGATLLRYGSELAIDTSPTGQLIGWRHIEPIKDEYFIVLARMTLRDTNLKKTLEQVITSSPDDWGSFEPYRKREELKPKMASIKEQTMSPVNIVILANPTDAAGLEYPLGVEVAPALDTNGVRSFLESHTGSHALVVPSELWDPQLSPLPRWQVDIPVDQVAALTEAITAADSRLK